MTILPIMTGKDVSIWVNNQELALAEYCEVSAQRELQKIGAYGESSPVGVEVGETVYHLLIKRAKLCTKALQDKICIEELADFTISLKEPNRTVAYKNCIWDGVIWKIDVENHWIEEASAISFEEFVS